MDDENDDENVVERNVQDKIQQYDAELQSIRAVLLTTTTSTDDNNNDDETRILNDTSFNVATEFLQMKLQFLQECSTARSLLDASIRHSRPMTTHTETTDTDHDDHDPLVQATKLLLQSNQSLQKAYSLLLQQQQQQPPLSSSGSSSNPDAAASLSHFLRLLEPLYDMYDAIHAARRRQQVAILTTLQHIWDTTISMTPTSLTVTTAHRSILSSLTTTPHQTLHPLRTFFHVYHILWKEQSTTTSSSIEPIDGTAAPSMFAMLQRTIRQWTFQIQRDLLAPLMMVVPTTTGPWRLEEEHPPDHHHHPGRHWERRIAWTTTTTTTAATTSSPNNAAKTQYFQDMLQLIQRIFLFIADHILLQDSSSSSSSSSDGSIGNHAVCQYMAQRFFGPGTTLSTTGLLQESTMVQDLRTVDGQRVYHDDIPRFGKDDDGLFIYPFMELMEQTFIPQDAIPPMELLDTLNEISRQVQSIIQPFVQELSSKYLLPSSGVERIMKFVSNIDQRYVSHRRCQLLNQARSILMTNDYHNTITVGRPPNDIDVMADDTSTDDLNFLPYHLQKSGLHVFQLPLASISTTANAVLSLVRQIMDEVVATYHVIPPPTTTTTGTGHDDVPYLTVFPALLYRTARDVFDLYRMLIPVRYQYEIHQVPRTAAIHHNDGVYLAHYCGILGLEYQPKLGHFNDRGPTIDKENTSNDSMNNDASNDDELHRNDGNDEPKQRDKLFRQTCVFLDMVPLFRDMAEKSMNHMIQLQCQQITELVEERVALFGAALKSNEIVVEWSDATEGAYPAGLYHLRHLYQNWSPPILPTDTFNRVMGYLIDVFLTFYLDQIAKATDISSVACPYVHAFFQRVVYDLDLLWQTCPNQNQSRSYYSRVWDKFRIVGEFMNMSMSDIQDGLSHGMFRTVTGPELSKLITSCFDDTPKRRALLHLIASNQ